MIPSQNCIDLVQRFESCRLSAFLDPVGIPTIGWGHTRNVHLGENITQEQADEYLRCDLAEAADEVEDCVRVPLTQNQYDALVSFEYNTGSLGKSTLVQYLNYGSYQTAADEFPKWVHGRVNGQMQVLPGLVKRRAAERELFLKES